MILNDIILPAPRTVRETSVVACHLGKLNWLEMTGSYELAASVINDALCSVDAPALPVKYGKMNIGSRQRITLQSAAGLAAEEYRLEVGNEWIILTGGSPAGVLHGARSLAQLIRVSAEYGGQDRFLPAGVIEDAPRFSWRGLMLDSARHFQKKEVILSLLEEMSRYKLNVFHWHLVDRQSWRLPLPSFPELLKDVPRNRCYNFGAYTVEEIAEIRAFAATRHIRIVPEIEMPGHSAAVFFTHPELACEGIGNPYGSDVWEYCLGKSEVRTFLATVLAETTALFPESEYLHIGGDEAGMTHWKQCPCCQEQLKQLDLPDLRALEQHFMSEMASRVEALGCRSIVWGTPHGSKVVPHQSVVENWLSPDLSEFADSSCAIINALHSANYFDYPTGDTEPMEKWQKINYEFDPIPPHCCCAPERIIGGEGCIWTEQLPAWRVLPRAVPRMRALAEMLWSPSEKKDFESFKLRERRLLAAGEH